MKVRVYFEKGNAAKLAGSLVFAGVLMLAIGFPLWVVPCFGVLYFAVKSISIQIKEKWNGMLALLMLVLGSVLSAYEVQYLLLDAELRTKISDTKMGLNVLCCFAVFAAVQVFVNNAGTSCMISHVFLLVLAGINYFVYLFRGNEFIFSDLKSISTGLSVAGNYEFVLDERAGYVILFSTLYLAWMRKYAASIPREETKKKRWISAAVYVSLTILCCVYIGQKTETYVTETWEQKGSYRNGYILNFVLSIRDSFVAEPEGYSKETVAELEAQYNGDTKTKETEEKPTILVIMSESYADLSVIGKYSTNIEAAPFYQSLSENTLKGYALSSVFGAKTPNSEWEFMTGNTMAFLPSGSVVYQQYISNEPTSVVSNLKNMGYTCVAMHPYYETGWSRNAVYPTMGFDEMYFADDFDQNAMLREYITDQEFYEKIIERYESRKKNEDLFIMGISMQNHGGYTEKYDNFQEEVRMLGINYPDVNQYLSLVHESDKALEYLISYFEQEEEPVEIVFFGDHQPSLSSSFYPYLNKKGLSGLTLDELEDLYTIPFFIWTNYETSEEEIKLTSINYLSTLALERAGIELSAYHKFLSEMMDVIPAINSRGYYSKSTGRFKHIEDAEGKEAEWLKNYEILQYNNMFDKKGKSTLFFPYLTE